MLRKPLTGGEGVHRRSSLRHRQDVDRSDSCLNNGLTIQVVVVNTEPLVVGCAADRHYALPLAVMLRSAADNLDPRRSLKVYVVDAGLDPDARARISASLPERVALQWLAPERSGFVDLPLWGRMTITTYDKLTIGRWLPASVGRALWLDCDMMVLGDLSRLWKTAQAQHTILAAQDTSVLTLGARFGVTCHQEIGIDAQAAYFNAGVMLIDLERWRSEDVAGRALAYLKRHRRRVYFYDQEALNGVLVGEWSRLDPRWNWSPGFDRFASPNNTLDGTKRLPWIVHFTGNLKPWRFEGGSAPYRLYYQYLDSTAWAGWRPAHNWRNVAMSAYESSRFRRVMYPLERLAMTIGRTVTLRYVSAEPN